MRKYVPKVGQFFKSREALLERLKKSGWGFSFQETYFHSQTREIIGYNVGVEDRKKDIQLEVELDYLPEGVRVTAVKWRGKEGRRIKKGKPEAYIPILGLDSEIKNLVRDLNEADYVTEYSCAGHRGMRGFVNFMRTDFTKDELEDIRDIFKQNRIERVTLRVKGDITQATFSRVG